MYNSNKHKQWHATNVVRAVSIAANAHIEPCESDFGAGLPTIIPGHHPHVPIGVRAAGTVRHANHADGASECTDDVFRRATGHLRHIPVAHSSQSQML